MYVFLALSCALVVCACAFLWLKLRRTRKLLDGLPVFPRYPVVGSVFHLLGDGEQLYKALLYATNMEEERPIVVWFGPVAGIMVKKPEHVKIITNTFIEKPYIYSFAREYVGNGLVTAPGVIWKRNIKMLAGTFVGSVVDGFQNVYNFHAASLVEQLKTEIGGPLFDLYDKYISFITLESICQTALGMSETIVTREYYENSMRLLELLVKRATNLITHPDFVYNHTSDCKELRKCIAVLHDASKKIIIKRQQEREDKKNNIKTDDENTNDTYRRRNKAFLDLLLDLKEEDPTLTDEQIRCEVDTIIFGGQESVATTVNLALLMLGRFPQLQDKLAAELKDIFGDSKRSVQKEDLSRMKYCDAVICETLRLYPPFPCVMRNADRDLVLDDFTVPKGVICGINIFGCGRSKSVWGADADEFRPERWLGEGCPPNAYSFIAFSYGKRACIGKRYAMAMSKTMLAYLVRDYIFTSETAKLRFKIDVSLKPTAGNLLQLNLRH